MKDSKRKDKQLTFKAFLSHSYKSPEINNYFAELFEEVAEVQFEVDPGGSATNVTRLERMIRMADAFVGIYPFPVDEPATPDKLKQVSRYFRLELELAIRARKPIIIYYDQRYESLFQAPGNVRCLAFNSFEVAGQGGHPEAGDHSEKFKSFCRTVASLKEYEVTKEGRAQKTKVCILLPPENSTARGYSSEHLELIKARLNNYGFYNLEHVSWPPVLSKDFFKLLHEIDWVIADIGDNSVGMPIVSYLHGRFIPTMRFLRLAEADEATAHSSLEKVLYGGAEVGYVKDIIRWNNPETLEQELNKRLESLRTEMRRINTSEEAKAYFLETAKRKETVFLSYCGRDVEIADGLSSVLKNKFQNENVFNYRDGESIRPGKPWLEEIFNRLSKSAIGIALLSPDYLESQNCMHELRDMVARRDNKEMQLIPIKLYKDPPNKPLKTPEYLGDIQYLRLWEYSDTEDMLKIMLKSINQT